MSIAVTNHLNFRGEARAALEFYKSVFGGDIAIVTYKDAHDVQVPAEADQVMWGQVAAKNGFRVMAYDVPSKQPWEPGTNAFFVSVRGDSADEIAALGRSSPRVRRSYSPSRSRDGRRSTGCSRIGSASRGSSTSPSSTRRSERMLGALTRINFLVAMR